MNIHDHTKCHEISYKTHTYFRERHWNLVKYRQTGVKAGYGWCLLQYRNNQEFIDTYLAEQEALRRQKEHEDHVRHSTIKMQAWWRGVMVRRKLGPYRSEEKKKKKPIKAKK